MLGNDYDAVIAAVGAEPARPPIPGADGGNVMFAVDALMDDSAVGQNVVVIGGGEASVETGMHLARRDEALSFYGCGKRFYMVGDCRKPSTIQVVNRSAYATASVI